MRAIFAILPLAGLLCCLSPAPEGSSGMWAAGFKHGPNLNATLDGGQLTDPMRAGLSGGMIDSLLRPTSLQTGARQTQPTGTLLADSVMVR
jgi:hypothetical protein